MKLQPWTQPSDWYGKPWDGWLTGLPGQHRDSDALERSNFAVALEALGGESDTVVVVHERHWAVGWIEWIAIHPSNIKAVAEAEQMLDALADYPILDETDYSQREWDEAMSYWRSMGLRARVELCHQYGLSIFAARRADTLPENDDGSLYEALREA